jgi:RND family efflux transporter MFP subunit
VEPERPSVRKDLAALRIDRSGSDDDGRPRWVNALLLAGLVVVLVGASWMTYRLTIGKTPVVRVGYAKKTGPGTTTRGTVLNGSGYVVTRGRYISLGVRVPGRIDSYLVDEGDTVKRGDPLVRLDARQYEAALREAEAGLNVARANVDLRRKELVRMQELRRREFSSEAELDVKINELRVGEAEIERLSAEVARLKLDLQDTVLVAPTNGIILEKFKEVGEIATPGGFAGSGDLIRMANLDELRAEVDVNEADLAKVRLGQPAEVLPDAYPERRYAATVVKLDPQINRQKGTLGVEVRILEPDAWLRPDMSVRIGFLEEAQAEGDGAPVVLAPRDALRTDALGPFVWVVSQERVRRQAIQTAGDAPGNRAVVTAGLLGGEALVVGEAPDLESGRAVQIAGP